jgi:phosphatidylinositol glycan class B
LVLGSVIFLITAINSSGYYYADEHFQLLEFAGYKLGWNDYDNLAWEYYQEMRPGLQPFIAAGFLTVFEGLGITDPFSQAFGLRLITAFFTILVTVKVYHNLGNEFPENWRRWFLALGLLLWVIPFNGVRFSSETWSGLVFTLSIVAFRKNNGFWFLLWSVLAFALRYQMLIASFPLVGYFVYRNYRNWKPMIAGLVLGLSSIVLSDFWLYGSFVLPSINYFQVNLMEGAAASFGTEGPGYYFSTLFHGMTWPLASLLFLSLIFCLLREFRNPVIWSVTLFLIVHSVIGHKELRFLFPFVFLLPYLFLKGLKHVQLTTGNTLFQMLVIPLGVFACWYNCLGIYGINRVSAGKTRGGVMEFIHEQYQGNCIIYHLDWHSPYAPWKKIEERFYSRFTGPREQVFDFCEVYNRAKLDEVPDVVVVKRNSLPDWTCNEWLFENSELVYSSIDTTALRFLKDYRPHDLEVYDVYEINTYRTYFKQPSESIDGL